MTATRTTATATASAAIWQLSGRRWQSGAELQKLLGVSARTFYRRLKAGEIESQPGEGRLLYRLVGATANVAPVAVPAATARPAATANAVAVLVARLEEQAVALADLRRENEQLREQLAQGGRRRLVASAQPSS